MLKRLSGSSKLSEIPLLSDNHVSVTRSNLGSSVYNSTCNSGNLFFKLRALVKRQGKRRHLSAGSPIDEPEIVVGIIGLVIVESVAFGS